MTRLNGFFGLIATLACALGCQVVSGLNDLEVEPTAQDETRDEETDGNSSANGTSDAASPQGCTIPSGLDCAPSDNCGCDEGQVCGLETEEEEISVACQAPGDKGLGEACNIGDCGAGLLCVEHVCLEVCRFDSDCEADNAKCTDVLRPNGNALKGVRYCQADCDLISPTEPAADLNPCPADQTCAATKQGSACTSSVGTGEQGDNCEAPSDCASGFTCADGQCKRWCSVGDSACAGGLGCEALTTDSPAAEGLGVCSGGCEATIPDGDECLTSPNCGCLDGETCRIMEDGARVCSPTGASAAQSLCDNNSQCAEGLACMAGLCRPYCDPTASECSDASLCIEMEYDGESVGVGACLGLCDPVRPETDDAVFTPCGSGAECIAGDLEYSYPMSHCMPAAEEPGPMLGTCDENHPCAAGAACLIGRCFPFCRGVEDCTGATEYAVCFESDLGFRGSEDDVLRLCCPPTPVDGSACAFDLDCGCDEDYSCRVADSTTGTTACTPVGDAGYQESCVYDTDCIGGFSCVGGLCSPHCIGTEPCAVNEGECIQVYSSEEEPQPVPYAFVCAGRCDPVDLTRSDEEVKPCGDGADCIAGWADATDSFSLASYCAPDMGNGSALDSCGSDAECALGLACDFIDCPTGSDCLGTCVQYCDDSEDCEPGFGCDLTVGRVGAPGSNVGYCRLLSISPQSDAG